MMKYQFPEEKEFILFFAKKLGAESIEKILNNDQILTEKEAEEFSYFYWKMVDSSIELEKSEHFPWPEGSEFWCEKAAHSMSGFINRAGFREIWNRVVNEQ
jgi:hypothetical protein